MRWYSSWVLIISFLPLFFLLFIWFPLMCWGSLTKEGASAFGYGSPPNGIPPPGEYVMK